ncbi:hypothetical protein [Pararhodospirillum photometricum]|nr:hypothetical protein [Pararhodospirillum photometricum]
MARVGRLLAVGLLIGVAAACGPIYETSYEFRAPRSPEGRVCTSQCLNWQQNCTHSCQRDEERCKDREREDARREYRRYVDEKRRAGQKVTKTESSFYDGYGCARSSCRDDCDSMYRQCFVNCGGSVVPNTVCTAFCDKAGPGASPPPMSPERDRFDGKRSSSGLCHPGRRVEVLWEGDWYPARVLEETGPGRCYIHYEGYGSDDDEEVSPRRMRPAS